MQAEGTPWRAVSADHYALGRAIRETRARRGMTQEGLAFAAGLHRNYAGALERGEVNPTLATLLKATDGLRVALSELVLLYERNVGELAVRYAGAGFWPPVR
jgi:transcriptional regulator with XRE-family HTH domain